jgi:hypothetical protein
MFRIIAGLVLVLLIWWVVWTLRKFNLKELTSSLKQTPSTILLRIKKLIYIILLICSLFLFITGIVQPLILGKQISGYLLMLHVSIAPIFAVVAAIGSVLWANAHSLNSNDWQELHNFQTNPSEEKEHVWVPTAIHKILFWIGILLSLPIILSIILSMYRVFGTNGQDMLLQIHRYCAMLFVIIVICYTSTTIFHLKKSNN